MSIYKISDLKNEILYELHHNDAFEGIDLDAAIRGVDFHSFTLEELGLPPASEILAAVKKIEPIAGLQGWKTVNYTKENYRGFSLTYNPDFYPPNISIYHQSCGSEILMEELTQNITPDKIDNLDRTSVKNTYYDSYGFRRIPDPIKENLGFLFDRFSMPLLRSRVVFQFGYHRLPEKRSGWHVDEQPYDIFRLNIPLQTTDEYTLDIKGDDGRGNSMELLDYAMEVGKVYTWNTRIPHRVGLSKFCQTQEPRITMVLGFSPWFGYDQDQDSFFRNHLWGVPMKDIIEQKLFVN
jgi:hypothetical protein